MCLQDVCISLFTMHDDMIAKVTDICSTDPNDPSHCATPEDIKVPKKKIQTIYHYKGPTEDIPQLQGAQHPDPIYWSFAKCLGEVRIHLPTISLLPAPFFRFPRPIVSFLPNSLSSQAIPQPPYKGLGTSNWFSTPLYPENNADTVQVGLQQAANNQKSYPAKGWPTYSQGVTPGKDKLAGLHVPVSDWKPGQPTPEWQPVAGGKGFGQPSGSPVGAKGGANGTAKKC